MTDSIVLHDVTRSFGTKVAVNQLDLVVPEGAVYGFIGPNGAGKTTTIRMIMSILFPDDGSISVLGYDSALKAKDRIGYLPEERGVYKRMRVRKLLAYLARLKGRDGAGVDRLVRQWLEKVGLAEVADKRCEELSKGMQQKVQFIAAVIHEPELLILDEPFSGLDPVNMRLLRELVLEENRRRGATIIFSTHVMVQAEQTCDHVVMINNGSKVLDESLAGIRSRFDPRTIVLEPLDPAADTSVLGGLPDVEQVISSFPSCKLKLRPGAEPAKVIADAAAAVPVSQIQLQRPTLEDVFVELVTGGGTRSNGEVAQLRAALRDNGAATGVAR